MSHASVLMMEFWRTNVVIIETLRRRSSEEFRRKMSQIFNERIHMNGPDDQLQLNPVMREAQRRTFRRTLLGPFRQ